MAESYGGWVNHQRVWYSYSVSWNNTHATIGVTAYLQMDGGSSSIGTWTQSWYGYWGSGSQSPYWNIQPNQSNAIASGTYTIALTDVGQTIGFGATGRSYWGAVTHELYVGIPARVPVAPSGLAVSRTSDTQHALSWTRNGTYTGVVVQRRTNDGVWQEIARPGGNVASYTDQTTQANRKYEYCVFGLNSRGQSAASNVATVYTTPAAPTGVSAVKVGFNIEVTGTGLPPYATSYNVFDNYTLIESGVTSFPWTHVSPDAGVTHAYVLEAQRGSLISGFSPQSNTVQLLAAPNAPANLSPNGSTVPSDVATVVTWLHNPVDTTAQTVFEIRFKFDNDITWYTDDGTTVSSYDFGTWGVGQLEWQVRTKGQHPDWSPWSAVATVEAVTRPGVAVLSPVGDVGVSFAVVDWSWFQAESRPQSAWRAELIRNGVVVEAASGSGPATVLTFTTPLVDGGTYTVRVQGATGDVWSAWAEETFTTIFPPPSNPVVVGTWSEEAGQHILDIRPGAQAVFAWTGDVNESPSTMTVGEKVTTNLVPNPLMSDSVAGWVSTGGVPVWDDGLVVTLGADEGVYVDLGNATADVLSAGVHVAATSPFRVAVYDPTGTSFAYWSEEFFIDTTVTFENVAVVAGKPLRLYVTSLIEATIRLRDAVAVHETTLPIPFDGDSHDDVATEYMTVERSLDGSVWEPVAAALTEATVIQDGEGLSRGSTWYRVTSVSGLPSTATTVVEVVSDSEALWLSGGVGFGVTARLPFSPEISIEGGRARSAQRYEGRALPVAYAGEQLSRVVRASGMLFEGEPEGVEVDALIDLAQHESALHLFRDPDGRRIYGVVSSIPIPRKQHNVWSYSFELDETTH